MVFTIHECVTVEYTYILRVYTYLCNVRVSGTFMVQSVIVIMNRSYTFVMVLSYNK